MTTLQELMAPCAEQVEADLERWLVADGVPDRLADVMRYSVLDGGKRLRPAVVHMTSRAVGGEAGELARRSAVAVELVHGYSLVHDDLPAMDDDAVRRGRPTVHVKFGEAMAILTGDALLTRAFSVLSDSGDPLSFRLIAELARGAGARGMIAGQVADMDLCDVPGGLEGLQYIHLRKTAALIRASARMGALCGRADDQTLDAVGRWGESLGLAFQLLDDILDVSGDPAKLGKTLGKDAQAGKRTYVALLGLDRSKEMAREMTHRANDALAALGARGQNLQTLGRLLAQRTY